MAKQRALFKVTGKLEDQSFYYSRVDGYQVRKLDPTLSERVKFSKNFVNTRNTAAEFRAVANTASVICKFFWDAFPGYLNNGLKPELVRIGMVGVRNDTNHEWGYRNIPQSAHEMMRNCVNRYSKNRMPEFIQQWINQSVTQTPNTLTLNIGQAPLTTVAFEQWLLQHGCTRIKTSLYAYYCVKAVNNGPKETYDFGIDMLSDVIDVPISIDITGTGNHAMLSAGPRQCSMPLTEQQTAITGLLVVVQPLKVYGDRVAVLNSLKMLGWYIVKPAS